MFDYGERAGPAVELAGRIHVDKLFEGDLLTDSLDSTRVRVLGRRAALYFWADGDVASLTLSLLPVFLGALPPSAGDPPVYALAAVPVLTLGAFDHDPGAVHTAVRFEVALPSGAEYVRLRAVPTGAERPNLWARLLWHDVPTGVRTVHINAAEQLSTAVDIGSGAFVGLWMPGAWTAADLNVHAAVTFDGVYHAISNDAGTLAAVKVAADKAVSIDALALVLAPFRYLKFFATVAQVAAADIIVLVKE